MTLDHLRRLFGSSVRADDAAAVEKEIAMLVRNRERDERLVETLNAIVRSRMAR